MCLDRLVTFGRLALGVAFVGFGALHLVHGDFVTRVLPWWPDGWPLRAVWASAFGVVMAAAGAALIFDYRTHSVASALGIASLVSLVALGLPLAATDAAWGGLWTVAGKIAALAGGALLLARATARDRQGRTTAAARLWPAAPWLFGGFLALCGVQHFVHVEFVTTLVPGWVPGARAWTYLTGVALVAGGIGVIVPATARLAGLLSAAMIFIWLIVLHIPRAWIAVPPAGNELVAVFEALAMSGIAGLVAATRTVPRRG